MKHLSLAPLVVAVAVGCVALAHAALTDSAPVAALAADSAPAAVAVPWGEWLSAALTASATVVTALVGVVVHRFLSPALAAFVTNDMIEKAVNYAIATTKDAVRGKEATMPVTNQVVTTAANWIIANEPKIADWAGYNLRPLIVARLAAAGVVPPEATAASLVLPNPPAAA